MEVRLAARHFAETKTTVQPQRPFILQTCRQMDALAIVLRLRDYLAQHRRADAGILFRG